MWGMFYATLLESVCRINITDQLSPGPLMVKVMYSIRRFINRLHSEHGFFIMLCMYVHFTIRLGDALKFSIFLNAIVTLLNFLLLFILFFMQNKQPQSKQYLKMLNTHVLLKVIFCRGVQTFFHKKKHKMNAALYSIMHCVRFSCPLLSLFVNSCAASCLWVVELKTPEGVKRERKSETHVLPWESCC